MNAVIYARYSSSNQREESIEGQLRVCNEYAQRNGITIVGTYIDRAMSATTDNRPDFQRMIKDSEKRLFDTIILYSIDRFARNRYDAAHYKMLLRKNGVKLQYASTNIPDSPEGIILESVMEGLAEYYSVELSKKVKRGLMENALHGKTASGVMPYGYTRSEDGKMVKHPQQSPIVVEIFQMYADGYPITKIAKTLNSRGIRTGHGAKWGKSSFNVMLTNRKYLGQYIYQDMKVQGVCEQIVSQELFDRVQEKIGFVRRTKAHNKASEEYLLAGKLFCGHCGRQMNGESGKSHTGTIHRYYKCFGRKVLHDCDKATENKRQLEDIVIRTTVTHVLTDEIIDTIAEKAHALMVKEAEEDAFLLNAKSRLSEVEKSIGNIMKAIEAGIFTESTRDRLTALETQRKELVIFIEKEKVSNTVLTKDQIAFWLTSFRYGDMNDQKFRNNIVNTLVNKVYVYDIKNGNDGDRNRKIRIVFNLSEHNEVEVLGSDFDGQSPLHSAVPNLSYYIFSTKKAFGIEIEDIR